ncbi:MAG TPA: class I SAM-dependent methyltransferase [Capillimicrobium sp.]|jgi:ubiquinone/menaquinone biosynthesis C-methylase UbiE
MTVTTMSTTARQWGELWGDRPADWAANEEQQTAVYERVLEEVHVGAGTRVLDAGCGTGVFLRLCADRGARVDGLDASEGLLAVARRRVPEAALVQGDLQALPYADESFDVVTGFASFFFADDMVAALREAGRVARPGAPVVVEVFGAPERCDLELVKRAVAPFRGGDAEDRYWRPGATEELVEQAGLAVRSSFDVVSEYVYPSAGALADAMLAAGGAAAVAGPAHEGELRDAIVRELAGCRQADGSYRLSNEWHVVIAGA